MGTSVSNWINATHARRLLIVRYPMMQPWLIVSLLFLGLIGLNISFFLCARAIKRDMKSRFDELERRLESRATDLVNHLFDANRS